MKELRKNFVERLHDCDSIETLNAWYENCVNEMAILNAKNCLTSLEFAEEQKVLYMLYKAVKDVILIFLYD